MESVKSKGEKIIVSHKDKAESQILGNMHLCARYKYVGRKRNLKIPSSTYFTQRCIFILRLIWFMQSVFANIFLSLFALNLHFHSYVFNSITAN